MFKNHKKSKRIALNAAFGDELVDVAVERLVGGPQPLPEVGEGNGRFGVARHPIVEHRGRRQRQSGSTEDEGDPQENPSYKSKI